jgi:hypothetical protein
MKRTVLVAVLLVTGCGKKSAAPEPPGEGEVAGVVLDLTGSATAQSPGQAQSRALQPGDELIAGDVIATAEGASLRARLYHNRAVLVLDGGKMMALRDSSAWRAAPTTGSLLDGEPGSEGNAVAGRHAEPQGADTRATAKPGQEPVAPAGRPPPPPEPKPDSRDQAGAGDSGGGTVGTLREPAGDQPGGTIGESGSLGRAEVSQGMLAVAQDIKKCQGLAGASAGFHLQLRVSVRPDGTVSNVDIEVDSGEPAAEVTRCIAAAVEKGRFPRSKRGVTFTYPVTSQTE